jgi:Protein of unknown function (DUF3987)/Primase C terminal 2 (PriCT-2)
MSALAADREAIGRFVPVLFGGADEDSYISLRAFSHEPGTPPLEVKAVQLNGGGFDPVVALATGVATRAAKNPKPAVFAPVPCTLTNGKKATESDVRNGLAVSVDIDHGSPRLGRQRLEGIIGQPATIVVHTGGTWTDPLTGEAQDRLHLYFVLSEPTRTPEEHARLKRACGLACALVGGDPSAVPLVHPMRWPGSWHRKGRPKLATAEYQEGSKIHLEDVTERLEQAATLRLEHATGEEADRLRAALEERRTGRGTAPEPEHDPGARDLDLEALADVIPNDDEPRSEWVAVGLAFYAASDGSSAGFDAWDRWSRKSTKAHGGTHKQWKKFAKSPPDRTGTGALVRRARRVDPGFRLPSWGPAPHAAQDRGSEETATAVPAGHPWPAPLAPEAFHGIAGEIVDAIEPESEADPAALLFQLLAAAGNIFGDGAYVKVEADKHPPRVNTVQVGRTSKARKGTSWSRIKALLEPVALAWARARIASGLSSGEGLIYEVRDPVMGVETDKKTKETHEVVVDPGSEDKRLLVVEDEFASVLRNMERQGNILSTVLRSAWDHGNLRTLIKNNPNRATGAHVSLIGHITDDELRRYLDRTEMANGLANRLLFVCARRSKELPRGGRPVDLTKIADRLRSIFDKAPKGEIGRTEAFWTLWESVYHDLSDGRPGMLGAILGRAEAQVLRLALIYALLDRAAKIDEPHLRAALACWRYAEDSALFIFGDSLGDPVADEILKALRERPEGMTRTELMHHFGRHQNSEQIGRALSVLERGGFARREVVKTPGRPTERWRAVK